MPTQFVNYTIACNSKTFDFIENRYSLKVA